MYVLTVQLTIKPQCVDDFMREVSTVRALIRREPECLRFDVLQDKERPESILLVEAWTSRDYFERVQSKRPYYQPYFERVRPMWSEERRMRHWQVIE